MTTRNLMAKDKLVRCSFCIPNLDGEHFCHLSKQNAGWTCHKCGSVYAPSVTECWRCNAVSIVSVWEPQRTDWIDSNIITDAITWIIVE